MSPILHLCNGCHRGFAFEEMKRGRCDDCRKTYEREKSRRRRATSTAVRTRDSLAWQAARAQARARDGGCVYRHQGGCAGELAVHHRIPLEQGGTNELANLITVCRHHHEEVEPR
jgi:5-methylcytosine-specific restriction endonuclease McrA